MPGVPGLNGSRTYTAAEGAVAVASADARVLLRKSMPHAALHVALDGAPGIEWIHTASAGFNWVLTPRVAASDIVVDSVGSTWADSINSVRPGGRVVPCHEGPGGVDGVGTVAVVLDPGRRRRRDRRLRAQARNRALSHPGRPVAPGARARRRLRDLRARRVLRGGLAEVHRRQLARRGASGLKVVSLSGPRGVESRAGMKIFLGRARLSDFARS